MTIDLNKYLGKPFDWNAYTCFHFTRDVWLDLTGVDMGVYFTKDNSARAWARAFHDNSTKVIGHLIHEIAKPDDPGLVLFSNKAYLPHCGITVGGKVLHLPKDDVSRVDNLEDVQKMHKTIITRFYK